MTAGPLFSLRIATAYGALYTTLAASGCFRSLRRPARVDALSRVPSTINVGVCLYACWVLRYDAVASFLDLERAAFSSSALRDKYLDAVSGYMIYDLVVLTYERQALGDLAMVLHHIVVICGLWAGVYFETATFYMTCLFANEVSTIFLNVRFLLFHINLTESKLYAANGVALAATFFVFRVVVITGLVAHAAVGWWQLAFVQGLYWIRPVTDRYLFGGLTLLLIAHWALNLFWFSRIWTLAVRVMRRALQCTSASTPGGGKKGL